MRLVWANVVKLGAAMSASLKLPSKDGTAGRGGGGGSFHQVAVVKCNMTIMSRLEFERAVKTEH
jgi:hypothetical protein